MIRRVRSPLGRAGLRILLFLLAILVTCLPVGILGSSNLVWGEDNQYGRVDVPGTGILHLPSGSVSVSLAIDLPGRGNGTPDLPLPDDLALTLSPVSGTARPVVAQDVGSSSNANDDVDNTQRQVWSVHVPRDGNYRVTATGSFQGIGVDAQLWFGHGPPLPGTLVPVVATALVTAGAIVWFLITRLIRRRPTQPLAPNRPQWQERSEYES